MNFKRNNLDRASSPYLQQHKDNPIYWQEWSPEVVEYAKQHKKLVLVSIGYATCHWCHVMAHDTFIDPEVAEYINDYFVALKVDREERPDIDHYLMSFARESESPTGWPLNVFLTPDLKPFGAVTYVAPHAHDGIPGFLEILKRVREFYAEYRDDIKPYKVPVIPQPTTSEDMLLRVISGNYDIRFGGFGHQQKFPPHNTLLFLLYYDALNQSELVHTMLEQTLDTIALRGLQDHLQGGFFRYCVDRAWTIPHFEKMLYDQALLLWVYSAGHHVLSKPVYKIIAEKIMLCLEETFKENDLYVSGHDADTEGHEGLTYLWSQDELEKVLSPEEYQALCAVYEISPEGNFEGKNHLIKRDLITLNSIESTLLTIRNKRPQPFIDKKCITSWNALTGIGFVMAYKYLQNPQALEKAKNLFKQLASKHIRDGVIYHSSLNGVVQDHSFLEDYASMLLLATYLYEETGENQTFIELYNQKINAFKQNNIWYETLDGSTLPRIPAPIYDHPTPSSSALAQVAQLRVSLLFDPNHHRNKLYQEALIHDFYNIGMLMANGKFHTIITPTPIASNLLPLNTLQKKGNVLQDCFEGKCKMFKSLDELLLALQPLYH